MVLGSARHTLVVIYQGRSFLWKGDIYVLPKFIVANFMIRSYIHYVEGFILNEIVLFYAESTY